MTYTDMLNRLSTATEEKVLALHERYVAGEITADELEELVAAVVATGNARAVSLADLSLAATLTLALRRPVPVVGIVPDRTERARLRRAARTILRAEGLPDTAENMRLARLARVEPLTAASRAYSEGIAKSDHVEGWRRGLSGSACQLCTWWSRDGQVWPANHRMPTHKGCTCTQQPVPAS